MTLKEADRAYQYNVPVQICGATAKRICCEPCGHIFGIIKRRNRHGGSWWECEFIEEKNGQPISTMYVDVNDIRVSDDASEIKRHLVYGTESESAEGEIYEITENQVALH